MSADLFAAFMAEGENPKQTRALAAQPATAPAIDLSDIQLQTSARSSQKRVQEKSESSPLWKRTGDRGNILFDADEASFDDDFGDFAIADMASGDTTGIYDTEGAARSVDVNVQERPESLSTSLGAHPLLADEALQLAQAGNKEFQVQSVHSPRPPTRVQDHSPEMARDDDWGDFEQTASPEPPSLGHLVPGQSLAPQPKVEETIADIPDDDWEPFDGEATAPVANRPATSIASDSTERTIPPATRKQTNTPTVFERPTNIPPPSSLLQLLSIAFQSLHNSNAEEMPSKQDLASQVIIAFRTASRIIAGRTLRWKRDTILAQSVRLGQAGKSGGMKLAAVNRSETTKEERDAEDLIEDWSNYLHEFNSLIAQAGSPPQRMKLSLKTSLKSLKASSNSESSKQCALCGLKRTERLGDLDADIDDLFGEFWVEHWGHKDCCDFWYSYKSFLGQR